jgi:hypothetical protein
MEAIEMTTIPIAEDPIEKLKSHVFSQAINATPIALAVLGWVVGMTITEPSIEELYATSDGFILVRHSDETTAQMLCSQPDFIAQVGQLCEELGLTAGQAEKVVGIVQRRLE